MELENETEERQPRERPLSFVHMRRRPAADEHLASGRQIEQAEQIKQRRLAGAGRPGDRDELIVADDQIDVLHQRCRHDAWQDAGDAPRLDQRCCGRCGRFLLQLHFMSRPG